MRIMEGLRDRYEAHHQVHFTDEALQAAVNLSNRYIQDRFLPDKAIDVLDEAGARMRIRNMTLPKELRELDDELRTIRGEKDSAIASQDSSAPLSCATRSPSSRPSASKPRRSGKRTPRSPCIR